MCAVQEFDVDNSGCVSQQQLTSVLEMFEGPVKDPVRSVPCQIKLSTLVPCLLADLTIQMLLDSDIFVFDLVAVAPNGH